MAFLRKSMGAKMVAFSEINYTHKKKTPNAFCDM